MKLELIRDKSRNFPAVENLADYSDIKIWHCRYQTFQNLNGFINLENIEIATYPDPTFEPISTLKKLRSLKIYHLPGIKDLTYLEGLENLEELELQLVVSQSKFQHIVSLQPLEGLYNLRRISICGYVIEDGSLQPLHSLTRLEEFSISNVFSYQEIIKLKAVNPRLSGRFLTPFYPVPYNFCSSCGAQKIWLSGVIGSSVYCPNCHKKRVQRHIKEWTEYEQGVSG
jgi:hypothetical protein